jgi:hypothetical protein
MKTAKRTAILAAALIAGSTLQGALILPYTEDFSSGTNELNMTPLSGSLNFNNFTYSIDGTGGVALFDVDTFLGLTTLENFSGLGVIGEWHWTGDTTYNAHTFTVESDDDIAFALTSLDWATGNGGPPTIYTITGFQGLMQVAQIVDIDLTLAGTYGSGTDSEIIATNIGPTDGSGYALHLDFSGVDWGNIDRFVFSATGNDILVALDNIEFSQAIPEPSTAALLIGAGTLLFGLSRRTRRG